MGGAVGAIVVSVSVGKTGRISIGVEEGSRLAIAVEVCVGAEKDVFVVLASLGVKVGSPDGVTVGVSLRAVVGVVLGCFEGGTEGRSEGGSSGMPAATCWLWLVTEDRLRCFRFAMDPMIRIDEPMIRRHTASTPATSLFDSRLPIMPSFVWGVEHCCITCSSSLESTSSSVSIDCSTTSLSMLAI